MPSTLVKPSRKKKIARHSMKAKIKKLHKRMDDLKNFGDNPPPGLVLSIKSLLIGLKVRTDFLGVEIEDSEILALFDRFKPNPEDFSPIPRSTTKTKKKKTRGYNRIGIFDFDFLFKLMDAGVTDHCIIGKNVRLTSHRYLVWRYKGTSCAHCGFQATYIALEAHLEGCRQNQFHFNAYGKDPEGKEIMLTKDHIIPKSKGGPDHLDNYQPLCHICNRNKGDKMEVPDGVQKVCSA